MGTSYNPSIITDGLVLCLDAANKRSYPGAGTVWTDLKESNNGTLTNGPTFSSDNGGSIVFDGTDDYVDLGSSLSISTSSPFSVEFWSNLSSYAGYYPTILQLKTNTSQGWNISFSQQSNYNGIVFGSASTWSRIKTDNPPSVNVWNHVCVTYDTSNYFIYLNLALQNQSSAGNFQVTTQNNYIGSANAASRGAMDTWDGYISNVKVYNKLLTFEQIRQNYNATRGRYQL
tara:strand:+ start:19419 stop:20108 length:690 start_codon:yes stop_codon:yes gene_type:complete